MLPLELWILIYFGQVYRGPLHTSMFLDAIETDFMICCSLDLYKKYCYHLNSKAIKWHIRKSILANYLTNKFFLKYNFCSTNNFYLTCNVCLNYGFCLTDNVWLNYNDWLTVNFCLPYMFCLTFNICLTNNIRLTYKFCLTWKVCLTYDFAQITTYFKGKMFALLTTFDNRTICVYLKTLASSFA